MGGGHLKHVHRKPSFVNVFLFNCYREITLLTNKFQAQRLLSWASNYEKHPLLNQPSDFPFLITKPNQGTCVMFTLKSVKSI